MEVYSNEIGCHFSTITLFKVMALMLAFSWFD